MAWFQILTGCCPNPILVVTTSCDQYIFSARYDILERIVQFAGQHENWELDEIITVSIFIVFVLAFFSIQRWRELLISETALIRRKKQLEDALLEIKQLKGIIPICASCKKIRDDKGF